MHHNAGYYLKESVVAVFEVIDECIIDREEERWVNDMYTGIIRRIRREGERGYNGETANELVGIDKIQSDIRRIRRWPIHSGNLAKLVSLVLVPILIELAARTITNMFGL